MHYLILCHYRVKIISNIQYWVLTLQNLTSLQFSLTVLSKVFRTESRLNTYTVPKWIQKTYQGQQIRMTRKIFWHGLSHNLIAGTLQLDRKTNKKFTEDSSMDLGKDFRKSCIRKRNTNHLPFKVHTFY